MIPKARRIRAIIQRGTRALQPLASDVLVGTIYFVTDELVIERSNGLIWQTYSPSSGVSAHATSHQNGGTDEINVIGLSGLLADAQTPLAHKTSHQDGGSDEIDVTGLSGLLATAQTPIAHKTSHQVGGSDALSVAGLTGLLATSQTPVAHASSHYSGGSDPLTISSLAGYVAPISPYATLQTTTATGTQNDFSLSARNTYLRCNNATALLFTGFTIGGVAPQAGDTVVIDNVGTSTVKVANENASSTAGYRIITASLNGQIIGATGRILGIYDATTARWRFVCVSPGEPINFPHSVLTFGLVGGTWTVDPTDPDIVKLCQNGKSVTYWYGIYNTDVSGAGTGLDISESGFPPGGFTNPATGVQVAPMQAGDAGVVAVAFVLFRDDCLRMQKGNASNWTATTVGVNTTFVRGSMVAYVD